MKGCGGEERGGGEREREGGREGGKAARTLRKRGRASLCAFVCVCAPVSAGGRTSKSQQSKGCFAFSLLLFFFFFPNQSYSRVGSPSSPF